MPTIDYWYELELMIVKSVPNSSEVEHVRQCAPDYEYSTINNVLESAGILFGDTIGHEEVDGPFSIHGDHPDYMTDGIDRYPVVQFESGRYAGRIHVTLFERRYEMVSEQEIMLESSIVEEIE